MCTQQTLSNLRICIPLRYLHFCFRKYSTALHHGLFFLDFLDFFHNINTKIMDDHIQEELCILTEWWHLSDLMNLWEFQQPLDLQIRSQKVKLLKQQTWKHTHVDLESKLTWRCVILLGGGRQCIGFSGWAGWRRWAVKGENKLLSGQLWRNMFNLMVENKQIIRSNGSRNIGDVAQPQRREWGG
jgi:hypothetical protein